MLLTLALLAVPTQGVAADLPPFDSPSTVLGRDERFQALLDVDGDLDLDGVGWAWKDGSSQQPTLRVYLDPTSAPILTADFEVDLSAVAPALISGQEYPSFTAVADFDGDARDDLALTLDDTLVVLRAGPAAAEMQIVAATPILAGDLWGVVTGDFDGDGDDDIVVAGSELRIVRNDSAGTSFVIGESIPAPAVGASSLVSGELDGVAGPDLVVGVDGALHVIPIAGGSFGTKQSFATTLSDVRVACGDVDGEGDDDVVAFGMDGTLQLLRQIGPGSLVIETAQVGGPATALADVNGDGLLDGVCCGSGPSTFLNTGASWFEIALGDGAGGFAPSFRIPSIGSERIAGVADLDGDGHVELVGGRCIYRPGHPIEGSGRIDLQLSEDDPGPLWNELRDAEGDGDPEYRHAVDGTTVNLADGTYELRAGNLTPPPGFTWSGGGFPVDFDGDGDTDLLAGLDDANGDHSQTRLIESRGGALFDAGPATAAGLDLDVTEFVWANLEFMDEPDASVTGDLDGDGDLDLVVNRVDSSNLCRLYLNDGAGLFSLHLELPLDVAALADFDGNGSLDLLGEGDNGIFSNTGAEVWLADGLGGYALHTTLGFYGLSVNNFARQMRPAVADFDGDGDLDLAVFGDYLDRNGIYWNGGSATFTFTDFSDAIPALTGVSGNFASMEEIFGAFVVEVDGDASPELLVGPLQLGPGPNNFIDQNRSWGVLEADALQQLKLLAVQQLQPSAVADVDGDGDTDAVGREVVRASFHSAPESGVRQQYGTGAAGTSGVTPTLGLVGSPRSFEPIAFTLRGGLGGSVGWFAYSLSPAPAPFDVLPGLPMYISPIGLVIFGLPMTGAAGEAGEGGYQWGFVVPPGLGGLEVVHQGIVLDAAATSGIASSGALRIVYGD